MGLSFPGLHCDHGCSSRKFNLLFEFLDSLNSQSKNQNA